MLTGGEGSESLAEGFARGGFDNDLPGIAAISAFMEGGKGRGNLERGVLLEVGGGLLDFGDGGFFGFVGDREFGEVGIGWELAGLAVLEEILGEGRVVGGDGGLDDGVIGLVGLDDDIGDVEMTATDAPDDLSKELKSAFLGSEVG